MKRAYMTRVGALTVALFSSFVILAGAAVAQQVHKWTDRQGRTHYFNTDPTDKIPTSAEGRPEGTASGPGTPSDGG